MSAYQTVPNSAVVIRAISYGNSPLQSGTCVKHVTDNHQPPAAPATICIEQWKDDSSDNRLLGITVGRGIKAGKFAGRTQYAYAVCVLGAVECTERIDSPRPGLPAQFGSRKIMVLAVHNTPHDPSKCSTTVLL